MANLPSDASVTVPSVTTGPAVDVSQITRDDGKTVVDRQRIIIGDPTTSDNLLPVDPALGLLVQRTDDFDPGIVALLQAILAQLNNIGTQLGAPQTTDPTSGA